MNKRKSKGMFFCISMPLFPYDVYFSIDEEDEVLFSRLKKKFSMTDFDPLMMGPTTQGRTLITNRGTTIIRLKKHKNKYVNLEFIAHESFHAILFIMESAGLKMQIDVSDEAYAYAVGFLVASAAREMGL